MRGNKIMHLSLGLILQSFNWDHTWSQALWSSGHHWLNGHGFGWTPGVGDGQTGRPDMLRFMGLQRVRHDWVTELNWRAWEWVFITLVVMFNSYKPKIFLRGQKFSEICPGSLFQSPASPTHTSFPQKFVHVQESPVKVWVNSGLVVMVSLCFYYWKGPNFSITFEEQFFSG